MMTKELKEKLLGCVLENKNDMYNIIVNMIDEYDKAHISINKKLIHDTPNDQELGGIVRNLYNGQNV